MIWGDLLTFLILTAGHTEILVTLVNRAHGTNWPHWLLQKIRHAHDLMMPLFPLVLLLLFWMQGSDHTLPERWGMLNSFWKSYLSVCLLGAAGLVFSSLRWGTRNLPSQVRESSSVVVDIARELRSRPVGNGQFRSLTKVPGNELFQVELTERTLLLPRLPESWEGTRVLHLSDWHFTGTPDLPFYESVVELVKNTQPEWILFTGDLIDRPDLVSWIPKTLGRLTAPLGCHYILGNHDWYQHPGEIREALNDCGWVDVAGIWLPVEKGGTAISLGGTEVPWLGHHPPAPEPSEELFRVLLSHTPDHFGWARRQRVDLMLSGHNHGGQVVLPVIGPVYSPSLHGVRFAGGAFYRDPTLLYVSRGLAARHPLRIGSRPEVTLLRLCRPGGEGEGYSSLGRRSIKESVASTGDFSSNST